MSGNNKYSAANQEERNISAFNIDVDDVSCGDEEDMSLQPSGNNRGMSRSAASSKAMSCKSKCSFISLFLLLTVTFVYVAYVKHTGKDISGTSFNVPSWFTSKGNAAGEDSQGDGSDGGYGLENESLGGMVDSSENEDDGDGEESWGDEEEEAWIEETGDTWDDAEEENWDDGEENWDDGDEDWDEEDEEEWEEEEKEWEEVMEEMEEEEVEEEEEELDAEEEEETDKEEGREKDEDDEDEGDTDETLDAEEEELVPMIKDNMRDVDSDMNDVDTPLYWSIPEVAEERMDDVFGLCLGLVQAASVDPEDYQDLGDEEFITMNIDDKDYLNVDMANRVGLLRAKGMGFAKEKPADVMVTPLLLPGISIFDEDHRARAFAMFMHPIERSVRMYFSHLAVWEKSYDEDVAKMTIEEFAESGFMKDNYMMRALTDNFMFVPGDEAALDAAKEVLRDKILVGLLDKKEESIERFRKYYGWMKPEDEDGMGTSDCLKDVFVEKTNVDEYPTVTEGSGEWEALRKKNMLDIQLYEYIEKLFELQAEVV